MTINVSGPNGVNVSFPDGTDAGTINSVMMQHFGGGQKAAAPDGGGPKAPALGRPWEAYGNVSGPDDWRSDPVATESPGGDWWKRDPVVGPKSHPAPPPQLVPVDHDPWAEFRVAAHPPLPEGFVLDKAASPSVGGRRSVMQGDWDVVSQISAIGIPDNKK